MKYMWCNCAEGLENVVFNYFTRSRGERRRIQGIANYVNFFAITAPLRDELMDEWELREEENAV